MLQQSQIRLCKSFPLELYDQFYYDCFIKFYDYFTLVIDIVINESTYQIVNCIIYNILEHARVITAKRRLLINMVVSKIWWYLHTFYKSSLSKCKFSDFTLLALKFTNSSCNFSKKKSVFLQSSPNSRCNFWNQEPAFFFKFCITFCCHET